MQMNIKNGKTTRMTIHVKNSNSIHVKHSNSKHVSSNRKSKLQKSKIQIQSM